LQANPFLQFLIQPKVKIYLVLENLFKKNHSPAEFIYSGGPSKESTGQNLGHPFREIAFKIYITPCGV